MTAIIASTTIMMRSVSRLEMDFIVFNRRMLYRSHIPCKEGPVIRRRHACDIHDAALQGANMVEP